VRLSRHVRPQRLVQRPVPRRQLHHERADVLPRARGRRGPLGRAGRRRGPPGVARRRGRGGIRRPGPAGRGDAVVTGGGVPAAAPDLSSWRLLWFTNKVYVRAFFVILLVVLLKRRRWPDPEAP